MTLSLKTKLVMGYSLIIAMTGMITMIIGTFLISRSVINQAQESVRTDLNSSGAMLRNRLAMIQNTVQLTTFVTKYAGVYRKALIHENRETLRYGLDQVRKNADIPIITVTDNTGRVVFRAGNPDRFGDDQSHDSLVAEVTAKRKAAASAVIVSRQELLKEGVALPSGQRSGMMLKAAAPVFDDDGKLIGVLYGGDVLNGNNAIVDGISNTLNKKNEPGNQSLTRISVFQNSRRIATNVMLPNGRRATGTRIPENVSNQVLKQGNEYAGRVLVVGAWYRTAYAPIRDIQGRIVGMLGVGVPEKKFMDLRRRTLLVFFGVTILGMALVLLLSNFVAERIIRPINYLVKVSRRISAGDFSATVRVDSRDEIGELQKSFNSMSSALQERDEELKNQTQQQLMRSEKLAALGRMAAGIAHEVNNPLTGVLMHAHFLLRRFPGDCQSRHDAMVVVNETTRCRDLLRNLLDFSRENEPCMKRDNINRVIEKTVSIVENQIYRNRAEIVLELSHDVPETLIDANQLEQVIVNLLLNAAESMADGGRITIQTSFDQRDNSIGMIVTDTGCGIPRENLDKIFDPFFTTRDVGKGTGLGLAVCYGIIKKHNGKISVQSQVGAGTSFTISIPVTEAEAP